jgi:hypothetical protein
MENFATWHHYFMAFGKTPPDCVFVKNHYDFLAHLPEHARGQKRKVWHIFFKTGQSMVIPHKSAKDFHAYANLFPQGSSGK